MMDLPLRIGQLGMPLATAERVMPVAAQVAGMVHERDIQAVRRLVTPLTPGEEVFALIVALAALVDVNRTVADALGWLNPEPPPAPAGRRRTRGEVVPPERWEELTPRARDIAQRRWLVNAMVEQGMSDRDIAARLGVAAATVARDRGYLGLPFGPTLAAHRQATGLARSPQPVPPAAPPASAPAAARRVA